MSRKKFFMPILLFLCFAISTILHAEWKVSFSESTYKCNTKDENLQIEIRLSGNGDEIESLGFDFVYDESHLQFLAEDFSGTLVDKWLYKAEDTSAVNTIRIGGFTIENTVNSPADEALVFLNFNPIKTGTFSLIINNFVDGLVDSPPCTVTCQIGVSSDIASRKDRMLITTFELQQNYPNPFNPTTTIAYDLPKHSDVAIGVYTIRGELVSELVNENQDAGSHTITWNATGMPSGTYFIRMQAGEFRDVKKCVLLR